MPNENAETQEQEPNNKEEKRDEKEEESTEHYENMVDDAILGVMSEESD
jgi:hypothetical protein